LQQVKVPQLIGVLSPSWVAENGSISLDSGPAFSSVILDASGGFKDITLMKPSKPARSIASRSGVSAISVCPPCRSSLCPPL
jgi:hypothetical protein